MRTSYKWGKRKSEILPLDPQGLRMRFGHIEKSALCEGRPVLQVPFNQHRQGAKAKMRTALMIHNRINQ